MIQDDFCLNKTLWKLKNMTAKVKCNSMVKPRSSKKQTREQKTLKYKRKKHKDIIRPLF